MRALFTLCCLAIVAAPVASQSFVNYESPQVHPIEISADGSRLFAVNTPDNRLSVFSLATPSRPVLLREVFVGLGPVSVRARTGSEAWVVNWLSDSVTVVDTDTGVLKATLRVKDEPTDVAFAQSKAFVSVSGSDEVRVFDAVTYAYLGTIPIFGDEPRAMVASADGKTVWTVVHRSGNDTTILPFNVAPAQPGSTNRKLPKPPKVGLIIDSEDSTWTGKHDVVLPDYDLVEIDVATRQIRRNYKAVGTINFGAAVRPGTNEMWVANTEARNLVRYVENLRGHAWDNRVTRVTMGASSSVKAFDLNPNIDYTKLPNTTALSSALAQPTDVVWDAQGKTMYVAAFGTDRIGMVDADGKVVGFLEIGDTTGTKVDSRNKRGPRGLALHKSGVLFVLNRLSNSITAVDTAAKKVLWELGMPDPTPAAIKAGRGFLYDAKLSGNGTFACAACHVDGDIDGLAWDLGDRAGELFKTRVLGRNIELHPMKGPMTTQTLRGLKGSAPFHWRGDKPRLQDFNGAFDSLMGKAELPSADMDAFATYMEEIAFPSNPNRKLDGSLPTQSAKNGESFYMNTVFAGTFTCATCHTLPTGSNGIIVPGSILDEPQAMKVAQLRNIYKKRGFVKTTQGRKSGFGLTHEGNMQDVFDFLGLSVFNGLSRDTKNKAQLRDFVEAFDTGTPPTVGYQVTVTPANVDSSSIIADVNLLTARAQAGDIQLVVKGQMGGLARGLLYQEFAKVFRPDRAAQSSLTLAQLQAEVRAGRAVLTLTGVAPGVGLRTALDRDGDGVLDGDEGVLVYGAGSKGCNGVPVLAASSEPRIGNPWFSLIGQNAQSQAFGILGIGLSSGNHRMLGVDVLIDITRSSTSYFYVLADPSGELALSVPIPSNPKLIGLTTYHQVVWTDPCGPKGAAATQGLRVTITK